MIVVDKILRIGYGAWRWIATGNAPFRIYDPRVGALIATVTDSTLDYRIADPVDSGSDMEEPPPLEILDASESDEAQTLQYPPFAILQWRGDTAADHYRIERLTAGGWRRMTRIREIGEGYYQYRTFGLEDGRTHSFRVIAIDAQGGESNPMQFDYFTVRNPEPPRWSFSHDPVAQTITVTIQQ